MRLYNFVIFAVSDALDICSYCGKMCMVHRTRKNGHKKKGGELLFEKIHDIRICKNITQEELAEKSGVSRTTIHGLETGKVKNTKTDTLGKIAVALGVSMDDLFFTGDVR